jgi:hypothetical protein
MFPAEFWLIMALYQKKNILQSIKNLSNHTKQFIYMLSPSTL